MLTEEKMQKVFSFVYVSLVEQGKPSGIKEKTGFRCLYLDPDNNKCAIGWLIPGRKYNSGLEDKGPEFLIKEKIIDFSFDDYDFLTDLQFCHDHHAFSVDWVKDFKREMGVMANRYGLVIPNVG